MHNYAINTTVCAREQIIHQQFEAELQIRVFVEHIPVNLIYGCVILESSCFLKVVAVFAGLFGKILQIVLISQSSRLTFANSLTKRSLLYVNV